MRGRLNRFASALLLLALSAQAAEAMVFSCFPVRVAGAKPIDAYVDGFAPGDYPPKQIESVRVLARFGADVFEFFPEHAKAAEVRDGVLRVHLLQPLSAGESAEIRLEGKLAAKKGEEFAMRMFIRSERRSGENSVRCTVE